MIKNFINTKIIFKKTIAMKMKKHYTVSEIEKSHIPVSYTHLLIAGHSADGAYEFSFVSGEKKQSTPLFWMSSLVTTYGSSADFDGGDISGMSFTEEERTALEEQFKERSEEILQQLGGGEFVLRDMRWRALRHLAGTGGWEFSGDYAPVSYTHLY